MADVSERLSSLVDAFLAREGLERGLADNTLEAYGRDLGRFREFLVTQGLERWEHLEAAHIRRFVEELERLNLAPRSRSRSLVSVRRLLEFACAEGLPLAGVSGGVASPGLPLLLPKVLHPDETRALIAAADCSKPLGLRDAAMVEVLYGAGLRVSEWSVCLCRVSICVKAGSVSSERGKKNAWFLWVKRRAVLWRNI